MRCLTASCEPFQKRVIGRFGDGRISPRMKYKQFKVKYSFFLKRQGPETLILNFKCECTSGELPSNCHYGGRTHVLQAWCERAFWIHSNLIKKNRRMSTCNRLDLQPVGSPPINAQKSPPSLLCVKWPWSHVAHPAPDTTGPCEKCEEAFVTRPSIWGSSCPSST